MNPLRFAVVAAAVFASLNPIPSAQAQPTVDSISNLYDRCNYEEVVRLCREYSVVDPFHPEVCYFDVSAGLLGQSCDKFAEDLLSGADQDAAGRLRYLQFLYLTGRCRQALATLETFPEGVMPAGLLAYWRGQLAYDDGQDSLALRQFSVASSDSTCRTSALQEIYRWYFDHSELGSADSILDLLDQNGRLGPWIACCRAELTGLGGDWPAAVKMFEQSAGRFDSPRVYQTWAYVLNNLGRYSETLKVLSRGLKAFPNHRILQARSAWVCDRTGRRSDAVDIVRGMPKLQAAFLHLAPELAEAFTLNDTLAIHETSLTTLELNPDFDYIARRYVAWLDERGRGIEADSLIARLAGKTSSLNMARIKSSRLEPRSPELALQLFDSLMPGWARSGSETDNRVQWLMGSGRRAEADKLVDDYLARCPGDADFMMNLAEAEYFADNVEATGRWLDRVEALAPANSRALWLRISKAHKQHDRDAALTLLDSMLAAYPNWSGILWFYRDLYGLEDSLALKDVIRRYGGGTGLSAGDVFELAVTYGQAGDFRTADSLLAAELERHPSAAQLYFGRGILYNHIGDTEKADQYYSRAAALDPANAYYKRGEMASTLEAQPLEQFTGTDKTDSTALVLLSVDSVRSLARAAGDSLTDYGGITVLDRRQYIYYDEYRGLRRRHYIAKLVSAKGKEYYGGETEAFNAWSEVPRLLLARVILPDGSVINIPPSDIQVTGSASSTSADNRNVTWHYPRVDSGAIVEFILQHQLRHTEAFNLGSTFMASDWDPVRNWSLELLLPGTWKIKEHHTPGFSYASYDSSGSRISRWSIDALKALKWEEDSPGNWVQGEWMRFAYAKTWRQEAERYWNRSAVKYDTSGPVAELARSLTAGLRSREDRIAALFGYAAREIRYEAVEFGYGSIIPRAASQVLANHYGDCKDKSVLLISLLKAVGITAYPALISSYDTTAFTRGVPDMMVFSHMITYLPEKPGRFLDPTCEACLPYDLSVDYKGKPTLVVGSDLDDPLIMTPPPEPGDRAYHRSARFSGRPESGMDMDILMEYWGDPAINWKGYRHSDTADLAEKIRSYTGVGLWSKADFLDYKLIDPIDKPGLHFSWSARMEMDSVFMKDAAQASVGLWLYTLDDFLSLPDTAGRTRDVRLGALFRLSEDYTIVPGDRWQIDNYRISWEMDTTWFAASSKVTEWPDSLRVVVSFTLKTRQIPVAEFRPFVKAVELVKSRFFSQSPVYRRATDPDRLSSVEKALEQSPGDLSLLMTQTFMHLGTDRGGSRCEARLRREKASDILRRALEHDASSETVVTLLASLLVLDGKTREADSLLTAYTNVYPMTLLLRILSGATSTLLARYDVAEQHLVKLMEQAPADDTRAQLIHVLIEQSKFEDARRQIGILEALKADSTVTMRSLMQYYLAMDSLDKAEELMKVWPDTSQIARADLKMMVYQYTEKSNEAYTEFFDILRRNPDNAIFLNNCAWYLALAGTDHDKALEMARKAVDLTGGCNTGYRNTLAVALLKAGRLREAREELMVCLEDDNAQSQTINLYFLGECALEEKNRSLAAEYFAKARDAKGGRYWVRRAVDKLKEMGAPTGPGR